MMHDSREAIFTIELPNGRVYTGAAMGVSISENPQVREVNRFHEEISAFSAGPTIWEIELRGIGPLSVEESDRFIELLEKKPVIPSGWECPYCGRNWLSTQLKCGTGRAGSDGCGASRPAMWWI